MKLRLLDIFAGTGGFRIGVTQAAKELGIEIESAGAIEFDKYAKETYEANFNEVPMGDITEIDPRDIEDHDILVGGFPCQPFSQSGIAWIKRGGKVDFKNDKRANLFFYLFNIIKEKKPKFIFLENVRGILEAKNEDGSLFIDTIKDMISEEGYVVEHRLMRTSDYGSPQARERVLFVATRNDMGLTPAFPQKHDDFKVVAECLDKVFDSKHLIENKWKNKRLNKDGKYGKKGEPRHEVLRKVYRKENRKKDKIHERKTVLSCEITGDTPGGRSRQHDRMYSIYGLCPTILTSTIPLFDTGNGVWRELTPKECYRIQGFPDNFIAHKNDRQAYKQAGNAVPVDLIRQVVFENLKYVSKGKKIA